MKNNLITPCYSIDFEELEYNFNSMKDAFINYWGENFSIGYSVKTNNLPWILNYMLEKGAYGEVVSSFEYDLVEKIGFKPENIIYNGPYKDNESLRYALENKSIVNVDSLDELRRIIDMNLADTEVVVRLNFDFESICPDEMELGSWPSRFGVSLEDGSFKEALALCGENNIDVVGLHIHQGLKKRTVDAFRVIARKLAETLREYELKKIKFIDVGGGYFGGRGTKGRPTFEQYAEVITEELKTALDKEDVHLLVEPGAALVSSPVSYFTRVRAVKNIRGSRIVVVDGSHLDTNPFFLQRTPDYEIHSNKDVFSGIQLVSGSTCLENDRLFELKNEVELSVGDIIEIKKCGGYTISLNNCFINPPPNVYLRKDKTYELVRNSWNIEKLF